MSRDAHYRKNTIQPLEVIESYKLSFILGNVIKYVLRAPYKNGREDLIKALWYLAYHLSEDTEVADLITEIVTTDPRSEYEVEKLSRIREMQRGALL